MKRVPIAALDVRHIAAVFAAGAAGLIFTAASAQNSPRIPPVPGQTAPAPGTTVPPTPATQAPSTTNPGTPVPTVPGTMAPGTTVPGTTAPPALDPTKRAQNDATATSTNPLLLGQVQGAYPTPAGSPTGFTDYRQAVSVGGIRPLREGMVVFGYEFFQPARDLVLAHRAFLQRQNQPIAPQNQNPAPQNQSPASQDNGVGAPSRAQAPQNPAAAPQDPRQNQNPYVMPPDNGAAVQSRSQAPEVLTAKDGSAPLPPRTDPINAFDEVADPLSQLYRNVAASVPPSYQLSGGDALVVRFWSPRHEPRSVNALVDAAGTVAIDEVGRLVVRGLTLEQAEKSIAERLRRLYNGIQVSVTLARLRTIQVTLTGAAFQPGTYAVPAVATAYNVLYAAGGPLEDGSLRAIEVRRSGKVVGILDLYNFILVGNRGSDIPLQSGDLIYIPHRRSRIAVTGEVLQPAIFEMREHETLKDVLQYAGGIRASAVAQRVRINTMDPGNGRIQKDVDLGSAAGAGQPLYDGDDVEVFSVRPLLTNTVTIDGAVDQPSTYALTPNMRVSDLVALARGVISEAYVVRAHLYRWNANNTTTLIPLDLQKAMAQDPAANIALQRWDRITVFTRKEVAWTGQRSITVRGAVQRAGTYTLSDNMHVSDLLLLAGGPMLDAYLERAVLLHQHGDGTYGLDYVNLAGISSKDPAKDVMLQDGDTLAVYRINEAQFEPEHVASIHGEVVAPGPFPRSEGMHLSDLIKLSGGFKPSASPVVSIAHARRVLGSGTAVQNLVRVTFNEDHTCAKQDDVVIEDGDVVMVQGIGGFVNSVPLIHIKGAVNRPGPVVMTGKTMRLSDALAAAGGLRPEAFPSGAEFYRDPALMATDSQRSLASLIGSINDLLNESTYNREKGKSFVERMQAVNAASQPENQSPLGTQAPQQGGTVSGPLATALAQQEMVSPARKLTDGQLNPNGNIAVNLPEALRHPTGADDILLVDGDTITVPETPTTVQVVGAVFHGRGVMYTPGASLDYYIAKVGGYAPDAAKERIEVIHMGGGLIPATKAGKLLPGDVIVVPTRVLAEKLAKHEDMFSSFFKSLTNSAIIFKVATSLFGL